MTAVSFYFDEMMPRKVANQLIEQGVKVIMAVDIGMVGKDDLQDHLTYATENKLVLVTFDRPFSTRAMAQSNHCGLICWTGTQNDFGGQIDKLGEFANHYSLENALNNVFWMKRS
ncbi:MAG: DUF5615 family PIN-like protein [Chloroflexi bacterium]|nr:DUF5615 family PIN-like protein [Chloroflexota bacterium]MCC6896254.1 DUF5615 family PIN-like protein [Anaerolineae bacterium]